jgi:hypothetical protein
MNLTRPLVQSLPHPADVRNRLGDALREVELLRRLLVLAERAELYRECDQERASTRRAGTRVNE